MKAAIDRIFLRHDTHLIIIAFMIFVLSFIYYIIGSNVNLGFASEQQYLAWYYNLIVFEFRTHINGILFYIPIIYASIVYRWSEALIVWSISMILVTPHIFFLSSSVVTLVTNLIYFIIPIMVLLIINIQLSWRNRERRAMAEREAERQAYISQIFKAQEVERQHIACELHDETTQTLLALANNAQTVLDDGNITNLQTKKQLESIRDKTLEISEDIRKLSLDLRPSILDDVGLLSALSWLVERSHQDSAINFQTYTTGVVRPLKPEINLILYRFLQEALNNIKRHSKATNATIFLEFEAETFKITIKDNGVGFNMPDMVVKLASQNKLGIIGMRERAESIGGIFKLKSSPGKGTSISLKVKINCDSTLKTSAGD